MKKTKSNVITNNENQLISFEIEPEVLKLGYIFNGVTKKTELEFELLNDKECDFIENAFYKNPLLREDFVNLKLDYNFYEFLSVNGINVIPKSSKDIKFPKNMSWDEKEFLYNAIINLFKDNPVLGLDLKGFDFDAMKNILITQMVENRMADCLLLNPEKIEIQEHSVSPEYYRLRKLYPDEIFENFAENPPHFDKRDFKSHVMELYDLIRDEFDSVFGIDNAFFARNCDFYYFLDEKENYFFVSPTISFEIYLKSKGSMYKPKKVVKDVTVIENGKFVTKKLVGLVLAKEIVYDYFLNFQALIESDEITHSTRFWNYLTVFAKDIIKALQIRPELVFVDTNYFRMDYTVDFQNPKLKANLNGIINFASENYAQSPDGKMLASKDFIKNILKDLINYMVYKILNLRVSKLKPDPQINVFYMNSIFKTMKNGKNIALSLLEWLRAFNRPSNPVKLELAFSQLDNFEYTMEIYFYAENEKHALSEVFDEKYSKEYLDRVYAQIRSASEIVKELKGIFCSFGYAKPQISAISIIKDISKAIPILNDYSIDVVLPPELENVLTPTLTIKSVLKEGKDEEFIQNFDDAASRYNLQDIMNFSYEISIGDEKISKEEFLELTKNSNELILFKNKYVLLNKEKVNKILETLNKPIDINLNRLELIHSVFSGKVDDFELDFDEKIKESIKSKLNITEVEPPQEVKEVLRPYQLYGYKWLYSNIIKGFGCCIADDMGLGKTLQLISLILKLKEDNKLKKPALVVCPTTLVGNWLKECEKFAPSLNVTIYHGLNRKLNLKSDVIITTYGHLRADLEIFKTKEWGMLVVDEAQNIKNPSTAQSKAIKAIVTPFKVAMTGTPIENRLIELWSIFDFINKGYLGTSSEFQNKYVFNIEKMKQAQSAQKLQFVTSPFILRRLKTDKNIINDLPEKIVFDEYCYLTKEQAALYETTLNEHMKNISDASGINRRGLILKLITSLKQICNHPANYIKNQDFSYSLSGKTKKIFAITNQILENNEKVLIFTQYKEMGDILTKILRQEIHENTLFFHGSLNRQERERLIDQFQNDDETKVMVLSLKAGGTGLNLTSATNVIHFDLWWNPAVEAQATDRTYRIGQDKNVTVHRLVTLGTFEEKIDEILKSKQQLVDMSLYTGETMLSEMSDEQLLELFKLN